MSSTAKGDKFEAKVRAFLEREIANGHFFARPECCKFISKPRYYSEKRKKHIVFDLSIEVYNPGQKSYAFLVLVECKDYGKAVPVDDAEEFWAKVQQVAGLNVKAIMISTNAFAQGVLEFCKSTGIGLARYYDKSTLKWELQRSPSSLTSSTPDWVDVYTGLVFDSYRSRYFDLYCYSGGVYTYSLYAFLRNLAHDSEEARSAFTPANYLAQFQPPLVQFVSTEFIEAMSDATRKKVGYAGGAVSLDAICQWQSAEAGLTVVTQAVPTGSDPTNGVLGQITFDPLKITIFDYVELYRGRRRFTLAHELAHYLLGHSKYMAGEICEEKDFESDGPPNLGIEDVHRMEWQANYFASCLLLPQEEFLTDFFVLAHEYDLKDKGHGLLFVDQQPCNQRTFFEVTDLLRLKYDVSRRAVEIRLKRFGLLADARGSIRSNRRF